MANPRSDMRVTHALLAEYAEKYNNVIIESNFKWKVIK